MSSNDYPIKTSIELLLEYDYTYDVYNEKSPKTDQSGKNRFSSLTPGVGWES